MHSPDPSAESPRELPARPGPLARLALAAVAALGAHCGARSAPDDPFDLTGTRGPCTWQQGAAVRVTAGGASDDHDLEAAFPVPGGALVGWRHHAPYGTPLGGPIAWETAQLGEDGAVRSPGAVLWPIAPRTSATLIVPMSLTGDGARLFAMTMDSPSGCRIGEIAPNGTALGDASITTPLNCWDLRATPRGFSVLDVGPNDPRGGLVGNREPGITTLDARGRSTGHTALPANLTPGTVGRRARAFLRDGTFVWAGQRRDHVVVAQHFDEDGLPLGPEQALTADEADVELEVAVGADGAVVAWMHRDRRGPGSLLRAVPVDTDAAPRGPVVDGPVVADGTPSRVLSAVRFGDDVMVSYHVPLGTEGVALRVQALDPSGQPRGDALDLGQVADDGLVRVVPTGRGVLVVSNVRDVAGSTQPRQVSATPLRCLRP